MGFLEGLHQTGQFYSHKDQAGELADIANYLELPLDIPQPEDDPARRPQVIRVAMQVTDPDAVPMDVQGIESITLAEYPGNPKISPKFAYLFKKPVGSNVSWGFSPVYPLGRGITDADRARSALLGDKDPAWAEDTQSRLYKIWKRTLADYEKSGFFTEGSVDRLIKDLVIKISALTRLWQDRKRSYLLLFGLQQDGRFIYPGQIPGFVAYFRKKLAERQESTISSNAINCVICHKTGAASRSLDQVLKFSTFDKPGFLPGGSKKNLLSVYPICEDCYALLQRGFTEADHHFSTQIGIYGLNLYVIPEVIGRMDNLERVYRNFEDYVSSGVQDEAGLFEGITERDASFNFHLLFTEPNQAQLRLYRMVEDVPPSHFRKILTIWNGVRTRFYPNRDETHSLDSAIRQIVMMVQSLAGKTDGEKDVMKNRSINLIADLFSNAYIEVDDLKWAASARLAGLVSDPDWLNDRQYNGAFKLERLWMLFEFLYAYNRHINQEEVRL
ncbi:MAG: TM1802 family CRISPR-associated protein [Chloroflexota bacterium]|nr:TM1802 family CRISPR-associated protein [Chloroflexota bacterium]